MMSTFPPDFTYFRGGTSSPLLARQRLYPQMAKVEYEAIAQYAAQASPSSQAQDTAVSRVVTTHGGAQDKLTHVDPVHFAVALEKDPVRIFEYVRCQQDLSLAAANAGRG